MEKNTVNLLKKFIYFISETWKEKKFFHVSIVELSKFSLIICLVYA